MGLTVEDFEKWDNQFVSPCLPLDGKEINVWVVAAKFFAERYINDPRYLPGDQNVRLSNTDKARKANEKFEMIGDILYPQKFSEFRITTITATRNISRGDEIFSGYGNEYEFNLASNSHL